MRGLWVSLAETHTSAAYTALDDAYLSELAVVGRVSILVQGGQAEDVSRLHRFRGCP